MLPPLLTSLVLALLAAAPPDPPEATHGPDASSTEAESEPRVGSGEGPNEDEDEDAEDGSTLPRRRFMLGLEGVVMQAPPLRPEVVGFDPRFLGRSVTMGGLGLFGRLRLHPRIAVEATVRSGSARYVGRETEDADVVSHDQVMADAGVLLFVAQGRMVQLAFDAGIGGMGTRVEYELSREGTQLFGSGLVRVGADAEFLVKRIAFVVSVRAVGVFTGLDRVRNRGALLEGRSVRAPVPALQTMLVGTAGVAYRF
ncbi:MAG: hypothetical protein AB1Z98_05915 [Nannocystaceae bacterium]